MSGTSSRYRKNYPVSWEQLQRDCRALAWKLLDIRADWSRIVAVARGGLVPAAVIARELNIRLVDTVCISSYTMRDQSASAEILKRPDLARVDETWLVVDDLVDTGKTAKIVREMFGAAHFATVYAKPAGRALVDSFVTEVSQDTWVLFPWDGRGGGRLRPAHRGHTARDAGGLARGYEDTQSDGRRHPAHKAALPPDNRAPLRARAALPRRLRAGGRIYKKTIECESSDILVAEEDGGLLAFRPARGPRDGEARGRRAAALRVPDGHMRRRKAARRGIGSAMLAACEEWARAKNFEYSSSTS